MIHLRHKKKLPADPNILLTDVCNQRCTFCFAQDLMRTAPQKMMGLNDFKLLTDLLVRNKVKTLRLLGGEPTLHRNFEEIIEYAMPRFDKIMLFTNGFIPQKNTGVIESNLKKFVFVFNIGTPGYGNPLRRREVIRLIDIYSKSTKVNIGFTIWKTDINYINLLRRINSNVLKRVGVRFGYAKTIRGERQLIEKKDYQKLGKIILDLVRFLRSEQVKDIVVDCGLSPLMFRRNEWEEVAASVRFKGWGCRGKWGGMDIDTDLTAFACYPFSRISTIAKKDLLTKGLDVFSGHFSSKAPRCS